MYRVAIVRALACRRRACLFLITLVSATVATAEGPNVVVILADDMGLGDVSVYNPTDQGDKFESRLEAKTLHLDDLARRGIRFTNAHTPSAVCTPTRYGLLTGRHPFRSVRGLGVQHQYSDNFLLPGDGRTLADVLREAGYDTAFIGKWHLGYELLGEDGAVLRGNPSNPDLRPDWRRAFRGGPTDHGFDYAFGHLASADIAPYKFFVGDKWADEEAMWTTGQEEFGVDLMRAGWRDSVWTPTTVTRTLRDKVTEYLSNRSSKEKKPFYLHFCFSAPHSPTAPHADFQGKTAGAYTDYVAEVDETVGAIVASLESAGVLDNTLVIFTTDNGAFVNMAQREGKNPNHSAAGFLSDDTGNVKAIRGQKFTAYEGGHRVPLIVRWGADSPTSAAVKAGSTSDALVSLLDVFPTVAAIAGADLNDDEAQDGFDITPLLTGAESTMETRDISVVTSGAGVFAITHRDADGVEWKLVYSPGSGQDARRSVDPRQADIAKHRERLQLFNLSEDLGESHNLLAGDNLNPATVAKLTEVHARMTEWLGPKARSTEASRSRVAREGLEPPTKEL